MENKIVNEGNNSYPSMKSHLILPLIFILTLVVAILFIAVNDFNEGLSKVIIYFYFGAVILYSALALFDLYFRKEKNKKLEIFILLMAILTILADILFLVFYLISR